MTAQPQWGMNYLAMVKNLVDAIEAAKSYHDHVVQDGTLPTQYLASAQARKDLVAADFTASESALVQIIFTYDSGAPAQKASLYKML